MSERTTSEATSSPSGRAADGRFAKGNRGGPGNPFAHKCAAFRAALMDTVTDQDIKDIAAKLRDDAKAGDKAAIKLLFQYVIGKPQPAVDPDTLDIQEVRGYLAAAVPPETMEEMQRGVPLQWLLSMWPFYLAAREQSMTDQTQERLAAMDDKDRHRAEKLRKKAERQQRRQQAREQAQTHPHTPFAMPPSENGGNGKTDVADHEATSAARGLHGRNGFVDQETAPSINGLNGSLSVASILDWLRQQHRPANGNTQT